MKRDPFTSLKRSAPRKRRPGKRRGRIEDPAYLEFIRQQPCAICWGVPGAYQPLGTCQVYYEYERDNGCPSQTSRTEAAHVGKRGLSQRCSDREAIPLCGTWHHREGPESQHVLGKTFWSFHHADREKLIAFYNALYESTRGIESKAGLPPAEQGSEIEW